MHRLLADNVSRPVADSFAYNATGTFNLLAERLLRRGGRFLRTTLVQSEFAWHETDHAATACCALCTVESAFEYDSLGTYTSCSHTGLTTRANSLTKVPPQQAVHVEVANEETHFR